MPQKNWLEWAVFAVSAVVLLLVFVFLGYGWVISEGDPAEIEIRLGTPEAHDGYYAIPVTFKNAGGQSVEDLEVEVTLMEGEEKGESASITVPFLPRESTREGWVAFSTNPDDADEVQTRIVSYVVP